MDNLGRRRFLGMAAILSGAAFFPKKAFGYETEIFRTSEEFMKNLRIPGNLAHFLESKGGKILIDEVEGFQFTRDGEKIGDATQGVYFRDSNQIHLAKKYRKKTMFHEIGHALWDPIGNDGIFDSGEYSGPTREDFAREFLKTDTHAITIKMFRGEYPNPAIAEDKTLDETFAVFFAEWMNEMNMIQKRIPRLYNAMTYMGKGLKSN